MNNRILGLRTTTGQRVQGRRGLPRELSACVPATIMREQVVSFPESAFHQVSRPARYTGGEWNSVAMGWDSASLRIALCYPDTYELGMSNLALPILYEILNGQPDVIAERVFTPWADMEELLRGSRQRLFSLETRHPLDEFDIVAFSLGYELTYTNVLTVLDLGGIPVLREQRDEHCPVVIAGGSCAVNPEPMSDFIDLFFIGEAEEGILELLDAFVEYAPPPLPRDAGERTVSPEEEKLTGFVFKVQANMDPAHRDRVAFFRVCSGRFSQGMKLHHVRIGKNIQIGNAITFQADSRERVDDAYPGDILGLHNHGTMRIGDTFTMGEDLSFTEIPNFAPELFRRAQL